MKKLTKRSLDELAKEMPILNEELQRSFIGGGNGTKNSPYTQKEYDNFIASGDFPGGYVDFGGTNSPLLLGAAKGETTITNGKNPEYNPFRDADKGEQWSMMFEGGYELGYKGGFWNEVSGYMSGVLSALGEEPGGSGGPQWDQLYKFQGFLQGKEDRERNYISYY